MTRTLFQNGLALCLSCLLVSSSLACLWDYDTLAMERQKFPSTLELITGKFLRHSKAFYEWRAADRQRRLDAGESTPELYDDLAVAFDKLGRQDDAIQVIRKKEELFPGLYETAANHGTFLIHAGRHEEGLVEIDKALALNADAHFGREIYQKLVVQYLQYKKDPATASQETSAELPIEDGFVAFLMQAGVVNSQGAAFQKEIVKARKGIEGMMKFGNYESPVLLEILGELLLTERNTGSSLLAARAFLKAELSGSKPLTKSPFAELAERAISAKRNRQDVNVNPYSVTKIRDSLKTELDDAQQWFEQLSANEARWIHEGLNADEEYTRTYYADPATASTEPPAVSTPDSAPATTRGPWITPVTAAVLIAIIAIASRRRKRANRS